MGTQRADMGLYKKFCLNLTTVAVPNLIAHELVMVQPMTSMSGYVAYLKYTAGTAKGGVAYDAELNSPFKLGQTDGNYTGERVVETIASFTSGTTKVAWTPVNVDAGYKIFDASGEIEGATLAADGTITAAGKTVTKVAYVYDNVTVPQDKLPTLNVRVENIPLLAKARRIAVMYSQMAAFQAKTDYGFDLGDQVATQAVGQLAYEIDTEVVKTIVDAAKFDAEGTERTDIVPAWDRTLPIGVSKSEHYEGFAEVLGIANQMIYDRTKKFAANYAIISSGILPILTMIKGFTAAPAGEMNGPYFAGTLNGLKVFVSPALEQGEYVVGVNGSDMMSSVAVYAPYMAIVPTQLLQYADGGTTQGFSTLYDIAVLNRDLAVYGTVTGDVFGIYGNAENPVNMQVNE